MRVLVADDDPVARRLIGSMLSTWGYEAVPAADGGEAFELLGSPDGGNIDIAILDWMMPGMDGLELCSKIRSSEHGGDRYVYLIILTGKNEKEDVVEALDAGADDFLTKPVDRGELRSRLNGGVRILEYKRELARRNGQLTESNQLLAKYASDMETLAEQRARQLIHSDRLSTIGEMAAGIAHEINNYLAPIIGYTDLLELTLAECADHRHEGLKDMDSFIGGIRTSANRIRNLVHRIKSHSRRESSERQPVNLNDIVGQSLELCGNQLKRYQLGKNLDEHLPLVGAYAAEIEQVVVNLLRNAADELEGKQGGRISVATGRTGNQVFVEVADNGGGIPPEAIDKIWQSFFTTKGSERGTGLGLSICKSIVESHGGDIGVHNQQSGGAVFRMTLPVLATG